METVTYSYDCVFAYQRHGNDAVPFCVFFASARELLAWSAISRIGDRTKGFQRLYSPSRARGVKQFFSRDPRNSIPTSIIVTVKLPHFDLPERSEKPIPTKLHVPVTEGVADADKPGLVIDGQHRLEGANAFNQSTLLCVVALINPTDLEAAFQFLVINNKSARVTPDHIHKLALQYDPMGLESRLRTARLSLKKNFALVGQVDEEDDSPFKEMIRWPTPTAQERPIPPSAIDTALGFIQSQQLPPLVDDNDSLLEFFYTIWSTVRDRWQTVWANPESTLLSKVGVVCLTQYITESLAKAYEWGEVDLSDPSEIAANTGKLLDNQQPEFWTLGWRESGLDTTAGRQLVVDDLTRIARNRRGGLDWFAELITVRSPESDE